MPGRPINVLLAERDAAHVASRYEAVAKRHSDPLIADVKGHIAASGRVSINCDAAALTAFLRDGLYKNRHQLVDDDKTYAGPGLAYRKRLEKFLGYGEEGKNIVYGGLNVGNAGSQFHGDFCIVFRREALEKNVSFMKYDSYHAFGSILMESGNPGKLEPGSRATWSNVSELAVVKLAENGMLDTLSVGDHPALSNAICNYADCIEAHVFGKLTPDHVQEIRVPLALLVRFNWLQGQSRHEPNTGLIERDSLFLWTNAVAIEAVESHHIPLIPTG